MLWAGKNVVVTGAASGIGKALTFRLADLGCHVYALDFDAKKLESLSADTKRNGWNITTHQADVTQYDAISIFIEKHFAKTALDIYINNAGIAMVGSLAAATPQELERLLDINLKGVIYGTKLALAKMEARGKGTIANLASTAGHIPAPFLSLYTASKFGVVGFTRAVQEELRQKASPIKLCLISPGFVKTEMVQHQPFPDWLSFMLSTPEAVAKEIVTGIGKNKAEVLPGIGGKMMRAMHKVAPGSTIKSSKVLLAKSFKDLLLRRFDQPD